MCGSNAMMMDTFAWESLLAGQGPETGTGNEDAASFQFCCVPVSDSWTMRSAVGRRVRWRSMSVRWWSANVGNGRDLTPLPIKEFKKSPACPCRRANNNFPVRAPQETGTGSESSRCQSPFLRGAQDVPSSTRHARSTGARSGARAAQGEGSQADTDPRFFSSQTMWRPR